MRFGIFVPPFDELADPRRLAEVARRAEGSGWDGFFVWDHVLYRDPPHPIADPWVALAAVACATERVRLGTLVTPLARRRVHKLARELATLDHLSGGRAVLGVGLGLDTRGELSRFGEELDARERARLLDEGLARLDAWQRGEEVQGAVLLPGPVQEPRVPVWCAMRWPNRRPLRRAARWDGVFPIDLDGPEQLAELVAEAAALRAPDAGPFDVVVTGPPDDDVAAWRDAGATWFLAGFGNPVDLAALEAAVAAGPPASAAA